MSQQSSVASKGHLSAKVRSLRAALKLVWDAAPRLALGSALLLPFLALEPLLSLVLLKAVVDSIVVALQAPDPLAALHEPFVNVALVGFVSVIGAALQAGANLIRETIAHRVTDHVTGLIQRQTISLDVAFFETPAFHDHLQRAQRDGAHRPLGVVRALSGIAQTSASLIGVTGLLIAFEPWILLIVIGVGLGGLIVRLHNARLLHDWQVRHTRTERLASILDWVLTRASFAKDLRLLGIGEQIMKRHRDLRETLLRGRLSVSRKSALAEFLSQCASAAAMVVAVGYAVWRILAGSISLGALVMYYQALQRAVNYSRLLANELAALYEHNLFLAHLQEFLDQKPLLADPAHPVPAPRSLIQGIRFEHVSFRYPGAERLALRDVTLTLSGGCLTALVGANGSGKSTLVKLLCRLYDPQEGRIVLDGHDLREFALSDLRQSLSVVLQDFSHFPGTVRENIAYGDISRQGTEEEVAVAARSAGAEPWINALPERYEAYLGKWFEGGHEVSTGEWQRLAIARSHFKVSGMLVLDEPTSSLDPIVESQLIAGMRDLIAGRTALVISHRFSLARQADEIVVLEAGEVAECGTHRALVESNGPYARMFSAQADRYRR